MSKFFGKYVLFIQPETESSSSSSLQFNFFYSFMKSARTPRCNFWEWLEDDEYQLQKNSDLGQIYNLTFKLGNLENEITYCRKKLEEEKNSDLVFRQELDKVKWKLFTHKAALFVLFFLYVKHVFFKV